MSEQHIGGYFQGKKEKSICTNTHKKPTQNLICMFRRTVSNHCHMQQSFQSLCPCRLSDNCRALESCYHRSTVAFTCLCFDIGCLYFTRDPFVLHQWSTEQGLVLQDFWGRRRRMSFDDCICLNADLKDRDIT